MQQTVTHAESEIRGVVDSVFRSSDYSRSWLEVLFAILSSVYESVRAAIARAARDHPVIFWTSLVLLVLLLALVMGRGAYLARRRAELLARAGGTGADADGRGSSDAWKLAQQLAARGMYADAAHALYRHLLGWLSVTERVELHPSKTVGDYGRDLRSRSSRVYSRYREFARTYEIVVYGTGLCDRDRYDRLLQLANAVTAPNG
jgi:hypothetical protein